VLSAEEGLRRLVEGNKRFVSGKARFPTVCKETLAALAKGQQPYATILGCADSRVPPELIFDANFGELFIIRVAGNIISPEVMGEHTVRRVSLTHSAFPGVGSRRMWGCESRDREQIKGLETSFSHTEPRGQYCSRFIRPK
jgi:Carbonic anhydrase